MDKTNQRNESLKMKTAIVGRSGEGIEEMVEQIMPRGGDFNMTVDPGEDLDYSFEVETEEEEEPGEISDEIDGADEVVPLTRQVENTNNEKKNDSLREFERLKNNPEVRKFLDLMNEGIQGQTDLRGKVQGQNNQKRGRESVGKGTKRRKPITTSTPLPKTNIVKSPSDTTLYQPALKQKRFSDKLDNSKAHYEEISKAVNDISLSNFPGDRPGTSGQCQQLTSNDEQRRHEPGITTEQLQSKARSIAEEMILNAERQKAAITAPTGTNYYQVPLFPVKTDVGEKKDLSQNFSVPPADVNFNDDNQNDFTQVAAHLDEPSTMNKIKVGGFIEIEKFAQKGKDLKGQSNGVELVHQDGRTFFIPASEKESVKVSNFQQWEQAFRGYAAIYSSANPHRAAEIYQYVHTINLAAQSYHWSNVAYYDYYFRKMMANNPQRSWAKTYVQLWTLAMRDPLGNKGFNANNNPSFNSRGNNGQHSNIEYCWRYNRNQCRKSAKDCKFEHRCSFCGIMNHNYLNCRKRRNNEQNGQNNNRNTDRTSQHNKPNNNNHNNNNGK